MTHIPTTCTTFAFRGCQLFGTPETAETPIFAFQTALTNITTIHKIPHNYMVHSWSFLVILLHMLVFETISLEYRTWPQRSNAPPFMLSGPPHLQRLTHQQPSYAQGSLKRLEHCGSGKSRRHVGLVSSWAMQSSCNHHEGYWPRIRLLPTPQVQGGKLGW